MVCANCHTERDWKGKQHPERWLRGAQLDFKPTRIMPWAKVAPDIAGLPMFANDEQVVSFFKTGLKPDKKSTRPPMPQYRLDDADAAAVVAYLRSLKPAEPPVSK
jgi:mono/diheme cytochrome c family protein